MDEIFRRLKFDDSDIIYDSKRRGWALNEKKTHSWSSLEWSLCKTISQLNLQLWNSMENVLFPPLPSAYKFQQVHGVREITMRRVRYAKRAFKSLAGTLSMVMARADKVAQVTEAMKRATGAVSDLPPLQTRYLPRWAQRLFTLGTSIAWIECLDRSTISKFNQLENPRIGTVFDMKNTDNLNLFKAMEYSEVPIWLDWHGDLQHFSTAEFKHYIFTHCPSVTQVNLAYEQQQKELEELESQVAADFEYENLFANDWTAHDRWTYNAPAARDEIPETGGQLQDETCWDFVHRRAAINWSIWKFRGETLGHYLLKRAYGDLRNNEFWDAVLKRGSDAETCRDPGEAGAEVWIWKKNAVGFRVRTRAHRGEISQLWDTYNSRQKVFEPRLNQWDVCTDFDEGEDAFLATGVTLGDFSDSVNGEADQDANREPNPPAHEPELAAQDMEQLNYSAMWGDLDRALMSKELRTAYGTLEQGLYYRFGLEVGTVQSGPVASFEKPADWKLIRKIVSDRTTPLEFEDNQKIISAFVLQVTNGICIADDMCDFSRVHELPRKFELSRMTLLDVPAQVLSQCYTLMPTTAATKEAVDWFIVLDDAAVVVECIRRQLGPSLVDIATHLAERGVAFKTLRRCSAVTPWKEYPAPTHGWRPLNYQPEGLVEYQAYRNLRDEYLKQRRMRAALMCGGIVWRLAVETLSPKSVIPGPPHGQYPAVFHEQRTNHIYYDDRLSVAEQDFICGVYKISTGEHAFVGRQYIPNKCGYSSTRQSKCRLFVVAESSRVEYQPAKRRLLVSSLRDLVSRTLEGYSRRQGWEEHA